MPFYSTLLKSKTIPESQFDSIGVGEGRVAKGIRSMNRDLGLPVYGSGLRLLFVVA